MAQGQRAERRNGKVVVEFKIGRNGNLIALRIISSSGNPELEKSAIDAVKRTAPFKSLPSEYREDYIDYQYTFDID